MIIFKKLFAPIALLLCFTLSLSLTGCSASSAQPFSKTGFYFDTVISLTCYGNDAEAVLNEAFELCGHYENLLSYTKEGSDIWNINHANGQPVTVDSETASLLQTALYWSEKTNGLIDPTITPISQLWNFSGDPAGPVPKQSQINALLPHIDYHNIRIDGNTVTLADPDAQLDLGFLFGCIHDIVELVWRKNESRMTIFIFFLQFRTRNAFHHKIKLSTYINVCNKRTGRSIITFNSDSECLRIFIQRIEMNCRLAVCYFGGLSGRGSIILICVERERSITISSRSLFERYTVV